MQALKKLPSFFNKSTLKVTDEYRENFLKAEATFKHQYVYDPIERKMVRLSDPDDEGIHWFIFNIRIVDIYDMWFKNIFFFLVCTNGTILFVLYSIGNGFLD